MRSEPVCYHKGAFSTQYSIEGDSGMIDQLKSSIRDIPDFPKKGILFKDITTLCKDAAMFQRMVDLMAHRYVGKKIDLVVGIEARGFVVGAALAYKLGAGLVTQMGGNIVECAFIVELDELKGRDKLLPHPVFSLIKY